MNIKSFLGYLVIIFFVILFFFFLPQPEQQEQAQNESQISAARGQVKNSVKNAKDKQGHINSYAAFNDSFLVRNVNLFDGVSYIEDVDVEVIDQKIARIASDIDNPQGLNELDAQGRYLIPGLIDSHTHSWGNALSEALNFGVTTELDMFTMPSFSLTHREKRGRLDNVAQADLFSATILATAPEGHGTEYGFAIPVLTNIEQVEAFVNDRVSDGADYIKTVYTSSHSVRKHYPSISLDILRALAIESKKHQRLLVVHVDDLISAKEAIEAGANGLVHSFMDKVVGDDFVELMKSNEAFIIPTLQVEASIVGLSPGRTSLESKHLNRFLSRQQRAQLKASFNDFGIPTEAFERAKQSVKRLFDAGVPILAGSDAPNPGTAHGASLHAELEMLVSTGLSSEDALMAATSIPSRVFQLGSRGFIQSGAPASMLLLESNPLENVEATKDILAIWKNQLTL